MTAPPDFLASVAAYVGTDAAPQPQYVLADLITELGAREVRDAAAAAHQLLPEASFAQPL
ncbi:MAG TPA: hypothetical protein VNF47_11325 [Streptosporangiaceae bacterium]|nr:hypothetical protein [Streptosporangiaceae bacterium]